MSPDMTPNQILDDVGYLADLLVTPGPMDEDPEEFAQRWSTRAEAKDLPVLLDVIRLHHPPDAENAPEGWASAASLLIGTWLDRCPELIPVVGEALADPRLRTVALSALSDVRHASRLDWLLPLVEDRTRLTIDETEYLADGLALRPSVQSLHSLRELVNRTPPGAPPEHVAFLRTRLDFATKQVEPG